MQKGTTIVNVIEYELSIYEGMACSGCIRRIMLDRSSKPKSIYQYHLRHYRSEAIP
jgi:hypothetical protein